jgi:hypothetical protein
MPSFQLTVAVRDEAVCLSNYNDSDMLNPKIETVLRTIRTSFSSSRNIFYFYFILVMDDIKCHSKAMEVAETRR